MKDFQHLLHVAAVFTVAIAAFLAIRHIVVPASFGRLGHYRADAVDEIKALPVLYAGERSCAPCHQEQTKDKSAGPHRTMACESCHGPALTHEAKPKAVHPFRPKEADIRTFCSACHERSLSRPRKFPQIEERKHQTGAPCIMCHPPHRPK